MTRRCNPFKTLLFIAFLGIFFFNHQPAKAQCKGEFAFQSFSPTQQERSGRIEVSVSNADAGLYTFKIYRMEGQLTLVESRQDSSPEKIVFERLSPSTYFIKIEWGDNCYKTLGGLDGIVIIGKQEAK